MTRDNGEPITIWPPDDIQQTARERLAEAIRMGGAAWQKANDRSCSWKAGIIVDLDEDSVLDCIVDVILRNANPVDGGP